LNDELLDDSKRIAEFLSNHQTAIGVADPDEKHILRHSYTTEFYAWLCALLYTHNAGEEWLERAIIATRSALDLIAHERDRSRKGNSPNEFHWEFKNLALVHVENLMGDRLPERLRSRLHQTLLAWRNLNIDSANWTAMRALSYELRYGRFNQTKDRWRSQLELNLLLSMQTPEGFFPDTAHSNSMQYHAYVLSLLVLYYRLTKQTRVRDAFLRGVRFVSDFVDPAGDFNYYGRGQRQLFGYASFILALTEAINLCADATEARHYHCLVERVLNFIRKHKDSDGTFPVVLNLTEGQWGWYDYNNHGDYLAFCGVWLFLAAATHQTRSVISHSPEIYTRCYPDLGLAVAARPNWFAVFSAGGDELSEPAGLIHFWPHGPLCLGGPDPDRVVDGMDYRWNYFGPLMDGRPILLRQRGQLSAGLDAVHISFSLPEAKIQQTYRWNGVLTLEQIMSVKSNESLVTPLFIAGTSKPPSELQFASHRYSPSPTGLVTAFTSKAFRADHLTAFRMQLAEGGESPSEIPGIQIVQGRSSSLRQFWKKALKAAWILWIKAIRN